MDRDIFEKIKGMYGGGFIAHGFDEHVLPVHRKALELGEKMGADLEVLDYAALLHDVGRGSEQGEERHCETGARIAKDFLMREGFSESFTSRVEECIRTHSTRPDIVPKTLEGQILREADNWDLLDAYGLVRGLMTYGAKGYDMQTALEKIKERLKAMESTFITEERKKFARPHLDYMWDFVKRWEGGMKK